MSRTVVFTFLSLLFLMGFSDAGQESMETLNIVDPIPTLLLTLSHINVPVAVSVRESELYEVSSSVLMAENWVRVNVLSYFPLTKITTIVVGNDVLCSRDHEEKWGLVLPSLKNIHHSLIRWGLEKEIKVSASFSGDCLNSHSNSFREDIAAKVINPLLGFFKNTNSTYCVYQNLDFSPSSSEAINLVSAHYESIKKLGLLEPFQVSGFNVVLCTQEKQKPKSRKLSFMSSNVVEPYPARPTPLPPIHSSIGLPTPANVAKSPLSPLAGVTPPPSMSLSFPPDGSPAVLPSNPPDALTLPPCSAMDMGAPAPTPETGEEKGLWCVSKPSVPADTLQEAMNYACGEGGADCDEIKPHGSCYNPDTVVAHASYAFNSYWQKNKRNGGTCSFGGTAMIINANPSFLQCRFILS
ncbi:glucan endo-1,3-beta-glucosidase 1-like [Macadamia integrifolia]|uniref:glucan endo-1,3-beta-glucosidase 1-like n=1 Tax=Macadamia integrifolia TaxID=60698 RepID=UPI001C4F4FF5|nr:glucan endo-1,3-beta-glucosidase 1-like [Macadamia integrifolia]